MPAETIDEVIAALDRIVDRARREESRSGYFPALYRKVTLAVRQGIADGFFSDPKRLERLDVVFANRYLDAVETARQGGTPTAAWAAAFAAARSPVPIVLQHLLLGMNAHINLDLGAAAAAAAPGGELPRLRADFLRINDLLASQMGAVKADLTEVWPKLRHLDRLAGDKEDRIANFSLTRARDHAWGLAEALSGADPEQREACLAAADRRVTRLAHLLRYPGPVARLTTWWVRLGERGTIPEIIDLLR